MSEKAQTLKWLIHEKCRLYAANVVTPFDQRIINKLLEVNVRIDKIIEEMTNERY